jgi:hypothetical protein
MHTIYVKRCNCLCLQTRKSQEYSGLLRVRFEISPTTTMTQATTTATTTQATTAIGEYHASCHSMVRVLWYNRLVASSRLDCSSAVPSPLGTHVPSKITTIALHPTAKARSALKARFCIHFTVCVAYNNKSAVEHEGNGGVRRLAASY